MKLVRLNQMLNFVSLILSSAKVQKVTTKLSEYFTKDNGTQNESQLMDEIGNKGNFPFNTE